MNKKIFASLAVIISIVFSFSICFANTNESALGNVTNGIRNFVGGTENTMENVASDVSNTSRNMTGDFENTMTANTNNAFMGMTNGNNNDNNNGNNGNNGGYTATRTATDDATVMGMTSTAWTWIILGVAAIAIIAVVWYYSMQFTNNNNRMDKE